MTVAAAAVFFVSEVCDIMENMKYYNIKYRYEDMPDYLYWIRRSSSISDLGCFRSVLFQSSASVFSDDALNSVILRYHLSYLDYMLVEVTKHTPPACDVVYERAEDLDWLTSTYRLPDDVLSGEWFKNNEKRKYYKIKLRKRNSWFAWNIDRGIYKVKNSDYGIIVSDTVFEQGHFFHLQESDRYELVEVQKPWHFSRIYYDERDVT